MTDIISFFISVFLIFNSILGAPVFFNVKIVTEPSVFECGNDNYCVIWETDKTANGYVTVEKNGEEQRFYDSDFGIVRTDDTIHSVKIPKSVLSGAVYTCHSQYVFRQYSYLVNYGPVTSGTPTEFTVNNNMGNFKALVLSDIHDKLDPVRNATKNFSDKWDILILNGDISNTLHDKNDFTSSVLAVAREFSQGKLPVAFVMGNHEAMGRFAPEIMRYFKTETNGIYYTFSFGGTNFIALDSGADKPDDSEVFNSLVDFKSYIPLETRWLRSLEPTDNMTVCLCHQPGYSDYSVGWTDELNRLNTRLTVCGHWHTIRDNYDRPGASFRTVITGGKENGVADMFVATMLSFNNEEITMLSYDSLGVCRYDHRII